MSDIGDLMQEYYLALSACNTLELVDKLHEMEEIVQKADENSVMQEILADCQKKTAQYLRSLHSESVRNMITLCRKQLRSKAALDSESSYQHGQRHLNAMVELLGGWSNVVAELAELNISDGVLALCVTPLHVRVAETAFGCFNEFKEDKNLDSWYDKALRLSALPSAQASSEASPRSSGRLVPAPPSSGKGSSSSFNLSSLDYIVSQLSAMRLLICQYQLFVSEECGLAELAADQEMGRWREVDGVYSVLETCYISRAVADALELCKDKRLLEVQRNVWALQVGP
jgi:hypothetical protein